MRKEKSRDAARSRRGKENHEFYELAKMLPLPAAITSQLDKASIIRLTISYLKLREFSQNGEPSWNQALSSMSALKCKANSVFESHQGTHILQSLDGFAFALGQDGRFLYISETVSIYLGLSQVEMTGSSIFDYTHQQDHAELAEQLGLNHSSKSGAIHHHPSHPNHPVHQQQSHLQHSLHPPSHHQHHHSNQSHHSASPLPPPSVSSNTSNESESGGVVGPSNFYSNGNNLMQSNGINDTFERQFCIRMKSTLTKRGCQHFKSSGYRVVNIVAHLRTEMLRRPNSGQINGSSNTGTNHSKIIGLVALAIALPPPSINELRLEPDMFVTRHSLDFKIIHCEQRVTELLNYCPEELIGRNFYSLIHGQDVSLMKKCHLDLLHKGQSMSGYYRIINKSGGYTWVQTCATLICNNAQANFVGQSGTAVTVCTNKSSSSTSSLSSSTSPSQISQNGNNNNNNNNGYNNSGQQDATTNSNLPNSSQQQQQQQEDQEQSVICVNYVLSAIEYIGVIMDSCQLGQKVITSTPMTKIRSGLKKSHSHASSPEIKLNNTLSSSQISSNDGNQNSRLSVVPAPSSSSSSSSTRPTASPKHETSVRSSTENIKRRRLNSSPVRPWKSPSPQPNSSGSILGAGNTNESNLSNNSPNLLRHISVIRETPPILKPQVMTPNPYHPHHYHHLVDQYASAYHLYKTGPNSPQGSDSVANPVHHASHHHHPPPHPHHWSTYGC
ncbi:Protein trachealess [Sarcoptes scabiei]|uniref:Protein trachealess n=1 Tax=Sarcoptes scabiei TaxID=52283 RepID=A0A834R5P7_SARSC|nr:Protein trachealess [Sarcoptes scabiei]